ncbi:MAG: translation elongation factor 4 [Erysipelotrichaceae bacterium]|nr:translation elongation factor 4 [Erysipelotrichaceae bacterium]
MKQENIRNFSIIAHIDHGKSTLADRILEVTNSVSKREIKEQMLDSMDIERERGITIKLNTVRLNYHYKGEDYMLNLIDTPGHVDFSYEVSRSLAATDGAILIVDATQGVEAQTIANMYLALDNNLTIIPVINKIDLPSADVIKTKQELIETFGFSDEEILLTSAKTGEGVKSLVEAIIDRISPPKGDIDKPLKALIFDSIYDSYRGVLVLARIFDGSIKVGDKIEFMQTGSIYDVTELFVYTPTLKKVDNLISGEVGYIVASIKNISDIRVGDTITLLKNPCNEALPGYKKLQQVVFTGLYPTETNKYNDLRDALEKLKLNDASLTFEPETSEALGFGFRCGFLGLLHMDVVEERLEREFNLNLIATSPSVVYQVELTDGSVIMIDSPQKLPDITKIKTISEPFILTNIFTPSEYIGPLMELCQNKRGIYKQIEYLTPERAILHYELPLSEIVYDFFDKLKSISKGYASFDYEVIGYKPSNLVKMDILVNGIVVDALSTIVHKDFAYNKGKIVVNNLKAIIPRQMFVVPIQAAIGSKIISRADIKAMRKDVLAKCYGGDVSRKKKLLEKQKEGKKRMKQIGNVEIPQEAFLTVLSNEEIND